jgi:hypothetical protein
VIFFFFAKTFAVITMLMRRKDAAPNNELGTGTVVLITERGPPYDRDGHSIITLGYNSQKKRLLLWGVQFGEKKVAKCFVKGILPFRNSKHRLIIK